MTKYLIVLALALTTVFSCSPKEEPPKSETREERVAARKKRHELALAELAKKHNAIRDTDLFPDSDNWLFAFEAQQRFADLEERIFIVGGNIWDVSIRNGEMVLEMEEYVGNNFVIFRIILDSNMVSKLKLSGLGPLSYVAVVTRIKSIDKIAMEITPTGEDEDIEISMSNTFIVKGVCIDFMPLK